MSRYDLCFDSGYVDQEVAEALANDINSPGAFTVMHKLFNDVADASSASRFYNTCVNLFGLEIDKCVKQPAIDVDEAWVDDMISRRNKAKLNKDYATADAIRKQLSDSGIVLEDGIEGTTWSVK